MLSVSGGKKGENKVKQAPLCSNEKKNTQYKKQKLIMHIVQKELGYQPLIKREIAINEELYSN